MNSLGIIHSRVEYIKSLYEGSEYGLRVCGVDIEWLQVRVGLRKKCVISHWLFNMDRVVRGESIFVFG